MLAGVQGWGITLDPPTPHPSLNEKACFPRPHPQAQESGGDWAVAAPLGLMEDQMMSGGKARSSLLSDHDQPRMQASNARQPRFPPGRGSVLNLSSGGPGALGHLSR